MDVSLLTIRLIVLLIPGVIAAILLEKLTIHDKWTSFNFIVYSTTLGALSYVVCFFAIEIWRLARWVLCLSTDWPEIQVWNALFNSDTPISPLEIAFACLAGVVLSLVLSYVVYKQLLFKFASWLGVSNKYGDLNLFSFFLSHDDISWVWIRDSRSGLTYEGLVDTVSESENNREVVLKDVKVYSSNDSTFMYETEYVYLSGLSNPIVIQAPNREPDDKKEHSSSDEGVQESQTDPPDDPTASEESSATPQAADRAKNTTENS